MSDAKKYVRLFCRTIDSETPLKMSAGKEEFGIMNFFNIKFGISTTRLQPGGRNRTGRKTGTQENRCTNGDLHGSPIKKDLPQI